MSLTPKHIAIVVIIAVAAAIAFPSLRKWRETRQTQSAENLVRIVSGVNARAPYEPAANIVVFRATMVEGFLTYGIRVENADERNVREEDRAEIRRGVTRVLCAEPEATELRRSGMTIRANVGDRTGTPITSVAVLPNGC